MMARFLFRNPRILLLTIVVIVVSGSTSLLVTPRLEDPVLSRRVGIVSTVFPGAGVGRVESLVTVPLEEALDGIPEIKQLRSNSQTGISNIVIELEDEIDDVDPVWSRVRDRLEDATARLPEAARESELQLVPLKAFAAIVALQPRPEFQSSMSLVQQLALDLRAELLRLPGTEDVQSFGEVPEEFLVELPPARLASLDLTTAAVAQFVREQFVSQPAGRLGSTSVARPLGFADAGLPLEVIRDTPIPTADGRTVALRDVADITRRSVAPEQQMALIDGQPAVVLGVLVSDDRRIDLWSEQLNQRLREFALRYDRELKIDVVFSQSEHVDRRMRTLLKNLGIGTLAVMAVVLTLMGWRCMLVVGAALPLSACIVLAGMRLMEIPIHQMSVTGLIVALGLLIDNAIVIVEDIRARIVEGTARVEAITAGVSHLGLPLFGSTVTTALAFLPIATLPGPAGEFVGTIATSVILAISASFLLAMTVVPALIASLKIDPSQRGFFSYGLTLPVVQNLYRRSLEVVFRRPWLGVLLGIVLPACGWLASRELPEQFFPPSDRLQLQIEVERSARDSIAQTRESVERIRVHLAQQPEVQRQHWFLGSSAPTFYYNVVPRRRGTPFYAQAIVDLQDPNDLPSLVNRLQMQLNRECPEARVLVRMLEQGPPFDAPIELRLLGPDLATLQELGGQLRRMLSQTPNVIHTRSDLEETIPGVALQFEESAAGAARLTRSQLAGLLYTTLEGAPAGSAFVDGREIPIRVRMRTAPERELEELKALPIATATGRDGRRNPALPPTAPPVVQPLSSHTVGSIARATLDADVGATVRIDGRRTNEIKAYVKAGVLPSTVVEQLRRQLADSNFRLPDGYTIEFGGETEQRSQAVRKLIANGLVLFALMLLTLVASFRSFRCALIIASVGGLSVGLGPLALSLFGFPFGFLAIVGTMGLIGVAINDSIVVLAAIRECPPHSWGEPRELVRVVNGCTRHVLATTVTTIFGFTPLLLGSGRFWPPLAVTIAGGVGGATLLAIYFVPSVHALLNRRSRTVAASGSIADRSSAARD